MRVLITGFDAFGGAKVNPAEQVVRLLEAAPPADTFEHSDFVVLPTTYRRAGELAVATMRAAKPHAVVMFGLSAAHPSVRVERFALNIADCPQPDNDGRVCYGSAIVAEGREAYTSQLDLDLVRAELEDGGVVAEVSNHAGTFLCNYSYYRILHEIESAGMATAALFVHLPWSVAAGHSGREAESSQSAVLGDSALAQGPSAATAISETAHEDGSSASAWAAHDRVARIVLRAVRRQLE